MNRLAVVGRLCGACFTQRWWARSSSPCRSRPDRSRFESPDRHFDLMIEFTDHARDVTGARLYLVSTLFADVKPEPMP